jgi:hypothetical protein
MRILSLLPGDQCVKRSIGDTHQYQEPGVLPARRPFVRIDDMLQPTIRPSKDVHVSPRHIALENNGTNDRVRAILSAGSSPARP